MTKLIYLMLLFAGCGNPTVFVPTPIPGPSGAPGQSIVGPPGPASSPMPQVTVVELCHTCVPSYPGTFAEYGLCIDNVLYGVYSEQGGFLAELPPGNYSSNGINCSCNLTVGTNCQVVQL